jgi:hypothetical protein
VLVPAPAVRDAVHILRNRVRRQEGTAMSKTGIASALIPLAAILFGTLQSCSNGDGSLIPKTQNLAGRWQAVSAVSADGCGLSSPILPIGFPDCNVSQSGQTLTFSCAPAWCFVGACVHPTGIISGDSVTITSVRSVVVDANCILQVTETDATTLSGDTLSGEANITVYAPISCTGHFPCLIQGPLIMTRLPPGPGFLCLMSCQ